MPMHVRTKRWKEAYVATHEEMSFATKSSSTHDQGNHCCGRIDGTDAMLVNEELLIYCLLLFCCPFQNTAA